MASRIYGGEKSYRTTLWIELNTDSLRTIYTCTLEWTEIERFFITVKRNKQMNKITIISSESYVYNVFILYLHKLKI